MLVAKLVSESSRHTTPFTWTYECVKGRCEWWTDKGCAVRALAGETRGGDKP